VSLYTWTKSIAAGAYLVALVLVALGAMDAGGVLWRWIAPLVSAGFLAATAGLLVSDLEHPERFYMILTRPQWNSWLVRGAVILLAYGVLLVLHVGASWFALASVMRSLMWPGLVLSALAAVYTAYLFAQSKGRDLWQSPLLPPHLLVQAVMAGSAVLSLTAVVLEPASTRPLLLALAGSCATHLVLVIGETTLTHGTAHARLAVHEMVRGRFSVWFWTGAVLVLAGVAAPWLGLAVAPLVLAGLLAYEHAYVQAGQAVALA
jgi:formate-dependent nitrite reductase membrane component NrfD